MADPVFVYKAPAAGGDGPLAGLTVALPANLSVRGWPLEAGTKALAGFTAVFDATVAERLRQAGASLAGTVHTPELGLGLRHSAVALAMASGAADACLAADTLGEARLAAGGGNLGFKPSYGLVSRWGLVGIAPSLEGIGVVAGSAGTLARIMAVLAGPDNRDLLLDEEPAPDFAATQQQAGPGVVLGILRPYAGAAGAERPDMRRVRASLATAGWRAKDLDFPSAALCAPVHQAIAAVEASSSCGKFDGVRYGYRDQTAKHWNDMYLRTRAAAFGPLLKAFLFQGAWLQFSSYPAFEQACRLRTRILREMEGLFAQADILVWPVSPGGDAGEDSRQPGALYGAFAGTVPANLAGLPALCLSGMLPGGASLQIVGRRRDDARVLAVGAVLAELLQKGT